MRTPDRMRWAFFLIAASALSVVRWAAWAPVRSASRDAIFEIPEGTWARRMAGNEIEILPNEIHLTLGVRDILVLKNLDDVPQIFGPTLMMPGQSFRLPFRQASRYQFACTAHASGQMTIVVEPFPATPWARLRWRLEELFRAQGFRADKVPIGNRTTGLGAQRGESAVAGIALRSLLSVSCGSPQAPCQRNRARSL